MECPKCHFKNPDNTRYCRHCATPLPIADETLNTHTATLRTPMPDITRGSLLDDRYEIIEEIGKGGMGKVYKAYDREINDYIALKTIRPEIASNPKIIERFQNELKTARKIAQRNVCKMFDVGRDGETRFITMEYVPGEDLKKSIRRMGPLTLRKSISIGKQICHGLIEAHNLGVFHRDLKPHNIMIDREGNVRIMDFGIALSQEARGITDSHIMIGTPQYLSPEQVEGKRVDQRSDIYSLGVILFEMVTGQVPFDGDTTLSIAVKHKTEIPRDPKELNAQIPEELSQLILKCMEKNPEKRYQTTEELCDELSQIEDELPTAETSISKMKMALKSVGINLKKLRYPGILLLFILLILVGYIFYTQILKNETSHRKEVQVTKWEESVLVLPIRDLSSGADQEPLGLVLTDMMIVSLNAFEELRLLPLSTSLAYQDSKKDIQTICDELKVSYVLEGTILRVDEYLKINLTLSSAAVGAVVWAKNFRESVETSLSIQEHITKAVAEALGIENVEARYSIITAKMPSESISDEYHTRGRYFELNYYNSASELDFENCVQNYLKVLEAHPDDVKTYWRLGNVHEARFIDTHMDQKYVDLMFHYFQKAYEIDPNAPESNMGVGWSFFYKKDNDKAYEFMKHAFELEPDNAEINFHIGAFFRSIGLYESALSHYAKALELDPKPLEYALWHEVLADCYSKLGRFEEADAISEKASEIQPNMNLYFETAWQLIMLGRYQEAEKQLAEAEKLDPGDSSIRLYRGLLFAAHGNKARALELIYDEDKPYRYIITSIYSLLGMRDEAIRNIQFGIDVGFEEVAMYLYSYPFLLSNPCYNNLKDDVQFQKILKDEKIKYDNKLKRYGDL